MLLGLVADTHGFLGNDVLAALAGADHILHAGDVGDGVLSGLRELAPLTAVRGNNDTGGEAAELPEVAYVATPAGRVALVHRLVDAPPESEWDLLVFGHCHRQHADERDGRLLLNPGAAGRRGFHSQRSVALLNLEAGRREMRFVDLGPRREAR